MAAEQVISLGKDIALGKITKLINTYIDDQYEYQIKRDVKGKLQQMGSSLTKIKAVLDVAEKMEIEDNHSLVEWLNELNDVVYDAEYVMDLFEYERLKNEVEGWPETSMNKGKVRHFFELSLSCCSKIQEGASAVAKRLVFADEDFNDLLRVVDKFDTLAKEKQDLISLLQLHCQVKQPITYAAADKVPDSRVTSYVPVEPKLYGREETEERLLELLQQDSDGSGTTNFSVVSVVGVGSVGKTTLSQFVFSHQSLKDKFDIKAWVCVSSDFSIERLMKNILEVASGMNKPPDFNTYTTFQKLQETVMNGLESKKFLIVLDDVWQDMADKWATIQETFSNGRAGSKIVITSRIHSVARAMGSQEKQHIKLNSLEFDDFWPFFQQCAFRNEDCENNTQLKDIGERIARKLGGLPLAAKVVGTLLYQNLNIGYWKQVLDSMWWKEADDKVLSVLKLSYDHLPLHLKKCFVYCCLFPKDYQYTTNILRDIWVALSCISPEDKDRRLVDIGTLYINELVNRSFLHDQHPRWSPEEKTYVIHDLLHDLAEKIIGDEVYRIENNESLSKEVPRNIRHLYIQSTYKGLDFVLQKIAPKKLQSLVYVVAEAFSAEEKEWKLSQETIRNIEGLRFLSVDVGIFSENKWRIWMSLGAMKHLQCANFAFKGLFSTHAIFPVSSWKPYQLKTLRSLGSNNLMISYLSWLKSLEMVTGCIFRVDGEDGNDIGQLGELNNIGGDLTLVVEVRLSKADAAKANLNRKQYLAKLSVSGCIKDEALEALQPQANLEELTMRECGKITVTPKWLRMLSNLKQLNHQKMPQIEVVSKHLTKASIHSARGN